MHRFDSFQHQQYFLMHAGNPHPFYLKAFYQSRFNPKRVFNMDRNKYCTLTRNMYLKIFDKIDKYNRRIATTTAPLIRSVAIPPLGFGVYNTQNTNTASECL